MDITPDIEYTVLIEFLQQFISEVTVIKMILSLVFQGCGIFTLIYNHYIQDYHKFKLPLRCSVRFGVKVGSTFLKGWASLLEDLKEDAIIFPISVQTSSLYW